MPDTLTPNAPPLRKNLILLLACLGQFMVVLDVAVVNVALPVMRVDLGFSPTGLQWVVNAYTLTYAGFLLLGGRVADLFGRRRMFLVGLLVFTLASLVCGFAPTGWAMITARAVQGVGAAILSPVTLTIVTTTFTEAKERSRALGMWSASLASGGAVGVLIGGILTDLLSWRWIFLINIPVGVVSAGQDQVLAPQFHSDYLLSQCTRCERLAHVPVSGHFDWLSPWPDAIAQQVGALQMRGGYPTAGFSAAQRQNAFDAIATFFQQHLKH